MFGSRKGNKKGKKSSNNWFGSKQDPEPEPEPQQPQPAMEFSDGTQDNQAAGGDQSFSQQVQGFGQDAFGSVQGFAHDTWDQLSGKPQGTMDVSVEGGHVTMETSGGIVQEGEGHGLDGGVNQVEDGQPQGGAADENKTDDGQAQEEGKSGETAEQTPGEGHTEEVHMHEETKVDEVNREIGQTVDGELQPEVQAEVQAETKPEEGQVGDVTSDTNVEGEVVVRADVPNVEDGIIDEAGKVVCEEATNVESAAGSEDQPTDVEVGDQVVQIELVQPDDRSCVDLRGTSEIDLLGGEVNVMVGSDGVDAVLQPAQEPSTETTQEGGHELQAEVVVDAHEAPTVESTPQEEAPKQEWPKKPLPEISVTEKSEREKEKLGALEEQAHGLGTSAETTEIKTCSKCSGDIAAGEVAVSAPKVSDESCWHPACFVCSTCDELLVDLVYCHHEGNIYCERHFSEKIKPRCAACDELIFSGEYTKAMDQDWHSGHFCCFNCDLNLTGYRYILRDEHPYCIKCYENLFANSCEECKTPIGTDSKDLSYKEKHWHEKCFKCVDCQRSLVDQPFASKNEKLYCADCHDNNFAARCDGCSNIFRAGMKKYEYKGKQWHEQCFCCKVCQQPIGNKSFIPRDQEVVCVNCYEEQYAQRCMKCNGVINKGGITYKGTPWHRDCFTCTNCSKVLAGDKFTSREDKPYCAECFGQLFAKKCCKCTNPITGLGGTKFISFEERHWHSDCFLCYKCNVSLVGRGFLTDATDILCPDCGRA